MSKLTPTKVRRLYPQTKGKKVLDAGTGSAILAIYASLKDAENVVAFDNDPVAIENAMENCGLNNVVSKIRLKICVLSDINPQPFDVIIANINKNILFVKYFGWCY